MITITKKELILLIEQEIRTLIENESRVIPVDFKNKTVGPRPKMVATLIPPDEIPEDEIPIEKTIAIMVEDMREQAMKISELSRAAAYGPRIEADMQEILVVIDELAMEL